MRREAVCWMLMLGLTLMLAGCSLFSGDDVLSETEEPPDPFAEGMLNAIGHMAPGNTPTQFLARIAQQLGWEGGLAGNTLLRIAVEEEEFAAKVEPFLYALFYKNGFSVLPQVGEGHQFSRDSLVRGPVGAGTFLVTTRQPVRIIFVKAASNVQIVYPQDGVQPQIFALDEQGVVAVRRSLLEHYLR
jgi:hypothetical protein